LYKMSKEIAQTLFEHLMDEGLPVGDTFLPAVQSSYHRESREALQRYRNLALINGLPFDMAAEQHAIDLFSKALGEAISDPGTPPRSSAALPSWKDIQTVNPEFITSFLSAIATDNAA